jgi:hypothetical protein
MAISVADGGPVPPAFVVERVEQRGRLSVAFRLLLLLPQVVVLYVLLLVGACVLVLGWFAALVLGRLPEPFARYLCHLIRYTTRVYAYGMLLTDRYPPFRFLAEGYPVTVDLAPGRLNRLAVLFRLFLAIPASILAGLVVAGWSVAAFVIWLLVLVAGRVPGALFDANTAVLRYNMRTTSYTWLVTAAYPSTLFGDRPVPTGPPMPVAGPDPAMPHHHRQRPQDHRSPFGPHRGARHAGRPDPAVPAGGRRLSSRAELRPVGGPRAGRRLRGVRHRDASDRVPRLGPSRGGGAGGSRRPHRRRLPGARQRRFTPGIRAAGRPHRGARQHLRPADPGAGHRALGLKVKSPSGVMLESTPARAARSTSPRLWMSYAGSAGSW